VFRVLILSHGRLAEELLLAAQVITERQLPITTLSLDWRLPLPELRDRVGECIERSHGEPLLILTALPGDTPTNVASVYAAPGRVEIVTGVNLAMVVRLACTDWAALSLGEAADLLTEKGRASIGRSHTKRTRSEPGCAAEPPETER
jgi:PTS system mannose-specific IIA component